MASSSLYATALIALTAFTSLNTANPVAVSAPIVKPVSPIAGGCRYIPSDPGWPSLQEWAALNATVHGRLIKTIPAGSRCFKNTYNVISQQNDINVFDQTQCDYVRASWHAPGFHEFSSSSIMQTYFANNSCNPIAPEQSNGQCGIGSYVHYSIDIGSDNDVKAGIAFGKKHNIRVLVRNTGHDYLGKSTGYGALALWTHHLKDISPVIDYHSSLYRGPALQVAAGVQVAEVYDYLEGQGYIAIGGECPTVGLAGGYIFSGGHAPISSKLGLAADKILEVQGILADGTSFTATPYKNQDLFWFLSGSGAGGTVAYIKNVTFKVFKDFGVSGAIFQMPFASILSEDEVWSLIDTWHSITPKITDAGAYAYAYYFAGYFQIWPLFAPDLSKAQTLTLLKPFTDQVDKLKAIHPDLSYNLTSYSYTTFNQAYKALFPYIGSGTLQWSSRLIPRNIIEKQPQALSKTFRALYDDGAIMVEAVMNPNLDVAKPYIANSVLPAWRTSIIDLIVGKPYNDSAPFQVNVDARTYITEHWTSALEQLAPVSAGGGAYMNEADADDPNWQQSFYGSNYAKQLAIKRKYDPTGFWYAKTAVGSEYWSEDEQQRLCPMRPSGRKF